MALSSSLTATAGGSLDRSDLVAYWSVPLHDGVHTIEFEHGTTTGRRVLRVDGKEIIRREWMYKLVGAEQFTLGPEGGTKCTLNVDPLPHFSFSYTLYIDGKPLEKFIEKQSQTTRSWAILIKSKRYRVVFEKQTLDVWINGLSIETENLFVDDGVELRFEFEALKGVIKASTVDKKQGVIHQLYVDGKIIQEDYI